MTIENYLDPKHIIFLKAKTRDEAIASLVDVAHSTGKLKNREAFEKAVLQREEIVSTGVGVGVAIPHAKMPSIDDFFIIIGIQHSKGLDWDSLDGAVVKLIFLIGGPPDRQTDYLQILSNITSRIKHTPFRNALLHADDPS
ncbi:MAG: PTS sugar transporter subunit IIA, partial [Simkaniaceae bacterium]|nr:PTS sugar transporter subunit IIA [Simkaniaceae bacterium]